jgi:phage terminase Nu1 subunit (DNA packaging protein)
MQTVTKWEGDGLPVLERGRKGKPSFYDIEAVRNWLGQRDEAAKQNGTVDVAQERARRERAQAVLAEQTFQMRSKELLPRVEVERVWEAEVIAVRTRLLAIPPTFADRVYQAAIGEGIGGVERVLAESVNDVLRELTGVEEAQTA